MREVDLGQFTGFEGHAPPSIQQHRNSGVADLSVDLLRIFRL